MDPEKSQDKPPVGLDVYTIIPANQAGAKPFWLKIGKAWVNRDRSLTVKLNALPLDGQLHIRKPGSSNG